MNVCHYCQQPGDLRPYGPGGSWTCFPCGTSPEHEKATEAVYGALLDANAALSPTGVVAVGESDGPRPFDPEETGGPTTHT